MAFVHTTCNEIFNPQSNPQKAIDTVEVRSSSLLVPTIFLYHLASLTSLRMAPNGSLKRADPEGMTFHTSSNPTSGEVWAAHFYGTGVLRPSGGANAVAGCCPVGSRTGALLSGQVCAASGVKRMRMGATS